MVNKDVYINIAVNVLRGFNGVRRLRPALLTCKVVTFLVHRSNTGSDALPDATATAGLEPKFIALTTEPRLLFSDKCKRR